MKGRDKMALDEAESRRSLGFGAWHVEDDQPHRRRVWRDSDPIQTYMRAQAAITGRFMEYLRRLGAVVVVALLVTPAWAGDELTTKKLFNACTGQEGDSQESTDHWISYCYGYLLGHYSAVSSSPTPFYCVTSANGDQLKMAYVVWYVENQPDDAASLAAHLWRAWVSSGYCKVDKKRYAEEMGLEMEQFDRNESEEH